MGDPEERRKRAVGAAIEVARGLGIDADDARLIKDSNNTIVHLARPGVVAKVGTTTLRHDVLTTLEQELRIGRYLAERGAPTARPAANVSPGPHLHDDVVVTLWRYVEPAPEVEITDADLGDMLRRFHKAFADYPHELPGFMDNLLRAEAAIEDREATAALEEPDRSFLLVVARELRERLQDRPLPAHPLHGDPHLDGNVLIAEDGPLLVDFEGACRGPYEWDVSALERAAVGYRDIDRELLSVLSRMRSLTVATWCWMQYGRAREVDEAAHVHLDLLRQSSSGQPESG